MGDAAAGTIVIPHLDDVAGSAGSNRAFFELAGAGTVSSGSVMVPSGWFSELAATPGITDYDLGLHITLTSESAAYRWRPLSTTDPATGLLDPSGYMWPTARQVREHADPDAVAVEIRAQIDAALSAGVDLTHLDHHMGAALAPEFAEITVEIAAAYSLPVLFPSDIHSYLDVLKLGDVDLDLLASVRRRAVDLGVAYGDRFAMPLIHQTRSDHDPVLRSMLTDLPRGITYLSLHAAPPGDIQRIHPKDAAWRIGEYEVLRSPEFAAWMSSNEFRVGGMREHRSKVRAG